MDQEESAAKQAEVRAAIEALRGNEPRPDAQRWAAALGLKRTGPDSFAGPCPRCGGTDRFHATDNGKLGLIGCRQCDVGGATYYELRREHFGTEFDPPREKKKAANKRAAKKVEKARTPAEDFALFERSLEQLGIRFAINPYSGRLSWQKDGGSLKQFVADDEAPLYTAIEGTYGSYINETRFRRWVRAKASENPRSPFRDWVLSCKHARHEDDAPPLFGWAKDFWGIDTDPLSELVCAWPFIIPVALALNPGARVRVVPLFVGGKGCGKSTFFEEILPPDLRQECWHPDVDLTAKDDDLARACRGKSIVVFEEMRGIRRAGWEKIKALTSATTKNLVPKYSELEASYTRTWCFVGLSNPGVSLPADSVARERFVPVRIRQRRAAEDPKTWLREWREHLFAQAYRWVQENNVADIDVPPSLQGDAEDAAAAYADKTDTETVVDDIVDRFGGREWVAASDLEDALPEGTRMRSVGPILRREHGWERKKKRDGEGTFWAWEPA